VKISRNAPCPCGSGQKYKKCCLPQHENAAAEAREERRAAEPATFVAHPTDLDELSNRANDLILAGQWNEAETCCRELLSRFPRQVDGHHRFYEYFKARGDIPNAMTHAIAIRQMLAHDPEGFDAEFLAELDAEITRFEQSSQPQHPTP
jgi:hypothetical protein